MKMARTLVHNLMHLTGQIYARYEIRNPDSADRAMPLSHKVPIKSHAHNAKGPFPFCWRFDGP